MLTVVTSWVASLLLSSFFILGPSLPSDFSVDGNEAAIEPTVNVLVATKNLLRGTVIKDPSKYFAVKAVSASEAPINAIGRFEEIAYPKLRKAVSKGSIITQEDCYDWKDFKKESVPPGHVAMPILAEVEIISGWIPANTRVDLVLILDFHPFTKDSHWQVVGHNLLILSIDEINDVPKRPQWISYIAVTPDQFLPLAIAQLLGRIWLFPRAYKEETGAFTRPARQTYFCRLSHAGWDESHQLRGGTRRLVPPYISGFYISGFNVFS
jgi:Flp pilus assembly protein CpaB